MKLRYLVALNLLLALPAFAFVPLDGTYNGLFYASDGTWQGNSGVMTIKTTSRATYSVKIQMGQERFSWTGRLDSSGADSRQVQSYYHGPITTQFQVDPEDPDLITGTISSADWTADLFADRAVFNGKTSSSIDAGKYTMLIPGDMTSHANPAGDGFGTITITRAGKITFVGSLADGTKISQSSTVSKGGQWGLYIPLYRGLGTFYGWMLFNGSADEDLGGDTTWIKPQHSSGFYYPDGFAIVVPSYGSYYVAPPNGAPIIDVNAGTIEFVGGDLDPGVTNSISLVANNKVVNQSANGLSMTFNTASGTFTGKVMHPVNQRWLTFRGVALQRFAVAAGYALGWTETSEAWLQGL